MSLLTLDTHAIVKDLVASGFSDAQAEAVTRAVRDAQNIDLSNLATKADVAELRAEVKGDIAQLRAEFKTELAELKADLLKWMFGVAGVQAAAILGGAATFLHLLKP